MIPVLKKHTVKKGESMIGIMKRNGLDPKDWKDVYQMSYNDADLAGYKKLGHIEPGDVVKLPTMRRDTFLMIEKALLWIEDQLIALLGTYGALTAEFYRLSRDKSSKTDAYEKVKGKLEKLEKKLSDAQKECRKVDQRTGKEPGLGKLAKCLVDAAPSTELMNELEDLRKSYKVKLKEKKDADKIFKWLDNVLTKREQLLDKAQDALRDTQNYFLKLKWQMYG